MSSGDEDDARAVESDDFPAVQRESSSFFTIHISHFSVCVKTTPQKTRFRSVNNDKEFTYR